MLAKSSLLFASAVAVSDDAWAAWKQESGRAYNSNDEDSYRRSIFEGNMVAAAEQQRLNPEAEFGATQFSDLSGDEFHNMYSKPKLNKTTRIELPPFVPDPSAVVDDVIDWQKNGAVTTVKNQGSFGTCWSFATSGTVEGQEFVVGGRKPVDLAQQLLIDCCSECYGHPDKSLNWILNNGMDTSESYGPYKGNKGTCKHAQATVGEAIVSVQVIHHEEDFMAALQKGPFHIAIDDASLQSYRGGVMTNTICKDPGNHDVLLVGAGEENGVKYWRVKNSWGTSFGESGYFRVIRDKAAMCLGKPNSFGSEATTAVGKPDGPTPTPTPTPTPVPSPTPGHCHAISALVTDDWCEQNCAAGFCPSDLCADCGSAISI